MFKPKRAEPGPGQESVWDYPRPPKLEKTNKQIRIVFNGEVIADTRNAYRMLETSHPPTYYIPPEDVAEKFLEKGNGRSICEWKGQARYFTLDVDGKRAENVGWAYPDPSPPFTAIKDYYAFYPAPMDECTVDDEVVTPQPGGFYGGWITSDVVGPFKGEPDTMWW